jgi:N,N'-diacetyl-8-epilegionaminate cytidylyltransferase
MVGAVIVSTDDEEIAATALADGAHVPMLRPAELATDTAPEWLAWRHAVAELAPLVPGCVGFKTFVAVPATAPLREPADIDRSCEALWSSGADIVISVTPAKSSPYFNMVELVGGRAKLAGGTAGVTRRQDAPELFDITPVAYATTPAHIGRAEGIFDGEVAAVVVPEERALDIDTPWDLHLADLVLAERSGPR